MSIDGKGYQIALEAYAKAHRDGHMSDDCLAIALDAGESAKTTADIEAAFRRGYAYGITRQWIADTAWNDYQTKKGR